MWKFCQKSIIGKKKNEKSALTPFESLNTIESLNTFESLNVRLFVSLKCCSLSMYRIQNNNRFTSTKSHTHTRIIINVARASRKRRRDGHVSRPLRRGGCGARFFFVLRRLSFSLSVFSLSLSLRFFSLRVKVVDSSLSLSLSFDDDDEKHNSSCGKFSVETPRIKCPRSSRFCFRRRSRPRFPWCCSSSEKCRRRSRRRF